MKTGGTRQQWMESTPEPDILKLYFDSYKGVKKDRVDFALKFMKKHFPDYNNKNIFSELVCIDFSSPVKVVSIRPETELVAFRDPRVSPFRGRYFTKSGYPAERLGIHTESTMGNPVVKMDKTQVRYRVQVHIPEVLESRCAATSDLWSVRDRYSLTAGGALQFLIPNPNRYLIYSTPFPKR